MIERRKARRRRGERRAMHRHLTAIRKIQGLAQANPISSLLNRVNQELSSSSGIRCLQSEPYVQRGGYFPKGKFTNHEKGFIRSNSTLSLSSSLSLLAINSNNILFTFSIFTNFHHCLINQKFIHLFIHTIGKELFIKII